MDPKLLLQKIIYFYKLAELNLPNILQEIEKLDTYQARKEYAEKHLSHLSSGSSRLVYSYDDIVIKLAKNDKGIAQNKSETKLANKSKYINPVLDHAKNYSWIKLPLIKKITAKQFKKLTGVDFQDFGDIIEFALRSISESERSKPANFDKYSKNDMIKELTEIGKQFKLMPGDLTRISSWGVKDNHPILLDSGLTQQIYDKFYE